MANAMAPTMEYTTEVPTLFFTVRVLGVITPAYGARSQRRSVPVPKARHNAFVRHFYTIPLSISSLLSGAFGDRKSEIVFSALLGRCKNSSGHSVIRSSLT